LRTALTEDEADALYGWMRQAFIPDDHDADVWYLGDPAAIEAPEEAFTGCPIDLSRCPWRVGDKNQGQLAELIGYEPAEMLVASAACNQRGDHLMLGHLCLGLARRFNAFVHFNGMLNLVTLPASPEITLTKQEADDAMALQAERIRRLPGSVFGLRYRIQTGRYGILHVGDATFLAAWVRHPRFRMIK
jgi:hypothetical protein